MKILILNGSTQKYSGIDTALTQMMQKIKTYSFSAEIEKIDLAGKKIGIGHCGYCGKCKSASCGCIFNNSISLLNQKVYCADTLIIGTPIFSGGMPAQLESAVKKLLADVVELQKRRRNLLLIISDTEEHGHNKKAIVTLDQYFRFAAVHLMWNYLGYTSFPTHHDENNSGIVDFLIRLASTKKERA